MTIGVVSWRLPTALPARWELAVNRGVNAMITDGYNLRLDGGSIPRGTAGLIIIGCRVNDIYDDLVQSALTKASFEQAENKLIRLGLAVCDRGEPELDETDIAEVLKRNTHPDAYCYPSRPLTPESLADQVEELVRLSFPADSTFSTSISVEEYNFEEVIQHSGPSKYRRWGRGREH